MCYDFLLLASVTPKPCFPVLYIPTAYSTVVRRYTLHTILLFHCWYNGEQATVSVPKLLKIDWR